MLEIEARSALIILTPPEVNQQEFQIDLSEFQYELHLSERKEGKYNLVYRWPQTQRFVCSSCDGCSCAVGQEPPPTTIAPASQKITHLSSVFLVFVPSTPLESAILQIQIFLILFGIDLVNKLVSFISNISNSWLGLQQNCPKLLYRYLYLFLFKNFTNKWPLHRMKNRDTLLIGTDRTSAYNIIDCCVLQLYNYYRQQFLNGERGSKIYELPIWRSLSIEQTNNYSSATPSIWSRT